ncbi:P-type ATPase [Heterostelium album PN500]|uniref:Phospholipid-transporting ATPase n=1 Tax=Heterostelium pallidum (strain ATCC 26659 / Pp 5 / PN500) TaxID=670386 RepID=D3BF29_HETP5|nr:P-type ATPase [Heterostelium album PN500]EFA80510.1 P-type ATPase [Heterostelium album PN500]|eukprot:XP_020432630.1 P-type ATPase [Heterostelium album PN500]
MDKIKKLFSKKPDTRERRVIIDEEQPPTKSPYVNNYIATSKYTLLTFLPKNLFQQFTRIANFYFLFIVIISFTDVSPNKPGGSIFGLVLVIGINAAKEAYEDFKRYQSDKEINNRKANVIRKGVETQELWMNLMVGDIVVVRNAEQFPADLVLLSSSGEMSPGMCFIETSNLDGETSLKSKQSLMETNHLQNSVDFSNFRAILEYEAPSVSLTSFNGRMSINNQPYSLSLDQLLIRGTVLMNTKVIYGVVTYTGHQTKYMLNTKETPSKRSRMDSTKERGAGQWYLDLSTNYSLETLKGFFTYVVLFATIAPFSLYVSLELARVLQLVSINKDKHMYHEETKTFAKARTSNLNEELGQVEYIFSDKTGTLTRNQMEFKRCSVNGVIYGPSEGDHQSLEISSTSSKPTTNHDHINTNLISTSFKNEEEEDFGNDKLMSSNSIGMTDLSKSKAPVSSNEQTIVPKIDLNDPDSLDFFLGLAICHTVIPESVDDQGKILLLVKYSSSSPDEIALVKEASSAGVKFHTRTPAHLGISVLGEEREYKLLNVLEFSSDRKRMSVIVKNYNTDDIILYCKGADSAILSQLAPDSSMPMVKLNQDNLHSFSCQGLRTLCVAKRIVTAEEYGPWSQRMKEANLLLNNRSQRISEVSLEIEKSWHFLGVVGIEDRLQEHVPETIKTLSKAGIKIWMLTGDKQETAINIGISCNLLDSKDLMILNENNKDLLLAKINQYLQELESVGVGADENSNVEKKNAIVIDGPTMVFMFQDKEVEDAFYRLSKNVNSVVCCRVTPFQKSEVVRIVKDRTSSVTLAIGDGANDVSMIQIAHVGIGISGFEGRQAVLASDYAISQFCFLERLLLVHGRYNFKRLSTLLCFSFWKNIATVLLQLWFNIDTQFSGQTYIDEINNILINILYTSFPIIVYAVTDRDIHPKFLKKYPILFKETQKGDNFNWKIFSTWILHGIYCSVVIYYVMSSVFDDGPTGSNGKIGGLWSQAAASLFALTLMIQLMLILTVNSWNRVQHWATWVSIAFFFVFQIAYSFLASMFGNLYYYMVFVNLLTQPAFYLAVIVTVVICLLPVYFTILEGYLRLAPFKGINSASYWLCFIETLNIELEQALKSFELFQIVKNL